MVPPTWLRAVSTQGAVRARTEVETGSGSGELIAVCVPHTDQLIRTRPGPPICSVSDATDRVTVVPYHLQHGYNWTTLHNLLSSF